MLECDSLIAAGESGIVCDSVCVCVFVRFWCSSSFYESNKSGGIFAKLHVSCVMLFMLNFLITFNPGCAVSSVYLTLLSVLFLNF